ncbi:MAG: hypothetical protein D6760_11490 [Deltaproteobacteria bacterium]|nr:MAG: hypothetical protein D6760_11490 [Deltaproteobacteria bacterium]
MTAGRTENERARARRIAAALAAVEAFMESERASAATSAAAPTATSPWLLAGRLGQMHDRIAIARRLAR